VDDRAAAIVAISGISFPSFWLGLLMIDLFSVRLGWLRRGLWRLAAFRHAGLHLGSAVAAVMARFTRSAFIEVAAEDYVRTRGPRRAGAWRDLDAHVTQCIDPVITLTACSFGIFLGGAIVSRLFSLGRVLALLIDSVSFRDYR